MPTKKKAATAKKWTKQDSKNAIKNIELVKPEIPKHWGKGKTANQPLLVPDKWNEVSGKDLVDMGIYFDSDSLPIATTVKYTVWLRSPKWDIHQL